MSIAAVLMIAQQPPCLQIIRKKLASYPCFPAWNGKMIEHFPRIDEQPAGSSIFKEPAVEFDGR